MFFLMLSVYCMERERSTWAAGAAYGAALCFKVVPAIVFPVLFLNLARRPRPWRERVKFCVAAGVVLLAAWSPFVFQDPRAIVSQVLGYRSVYGQWGLSFVMTQLAEHASWLQPMDAAFQRFGADLLLAPGGAGVVAHESKTGTVAKPRAVRASGPDLLNDVIDFQRIWRAVSGVGGSVGGGTGMHTAGDLLRRISAGVFLFLVYNLWAEGLPWYLADSTGNIGGFGGYLDYAQMACWLSVLVLLVVAWKRIGMTTGWKRVLPFPPLKERWRWAAGLATAAALFVTVPPQLPPPPKTGDTFEHAVRQVNSDSYLDLSQRLYYFGRYQDSIEAAHEAMAVMPEAAAKAGEIIAADEQALGGAAARP